MDHCGSHNWSSGTSTATKITAHGPGGSLVVGDQLRHDSLPDPLSQPNEKAVWLCETSVNIGKQLY